MDITLAEIAFLDPNSSTSVQGPPFPVGLVPLSDDLTFAVMGAEGVLRISDRDYTTLPTDSIPNMPFLARGLKLHDVQIRAFRGDEPDGRVSQSFGEMEISNPDARLDRFFEFGFIGRQLRVSTLTEGKVFSQAILRLVAVTESISSTDRKVTMRLRDPMFNLNVPIQTRFYKGTGGSEGATDIEGRPVPVVFGQKLNIEGVAVDPVNGIWQFHDGQMDAFVEVRDSGVLLTPTGLDVGGFNELLALTVGALGQIPEGKYATSLSAGLLRVGAPPAGRLTADVRGDKTGGTFVLSHADVVRRILETRLTIPPTIEDASFGGVNADQPSPMGWWSGFDVVTVDEAVAQIMASAGGFMGFRSTGEAFVSVIKEPNPKTTSTVQGPPFPVGLSPIKGNFTWDSVFGNAILSGSLDGNRVSLRGQTNIDFIVPSWRRRVAWSSLGLTQDRDGLGAISESKKLFFSTAARFAVSETPNILSTHRAAKDIETQGLYFNQVDAQTEANRLGELHKKVRRFLSIPVADAVFEFRIGDIWKVNFEADSQQRFGTPLDMTVIGVTERLDRNETVVEFFG